MNFNSKIKPRNLLDDPDYLLFSELDDSEAALVRGGSYAYAVTGAVTTANSDSVSAIAYAGAVGDASITHTTALSSQDMGSLVRNYGIATGTAYGTNGDTTASSWSKSTSRYLGSW
ncbi:MAG: hypothetical protein F6K10_05865 [Moorea sp. SIO2B7]|nr:hypothetical protein [Moorena sp. SIO2B7]